MNDKTLATEECWIPGAYHIMDVSWPMQYFGFTRAAGWEEIETRNIVP